VPAGVIDHSTVPIGTVPIYNMISVGASRPRCDDILEIERQAQQGIDYFTIHAGMLREPPTAVAPR
jgi:phosphomethylpyrimidine synthase